MFIQQRRAVFVLTYLYAWKNRGMVLPDDITKSEMTHCTFCCFSLHESVAQVNCSNKEISAVLWALRAWGLTSQFLSVQLRCPSLFPINVCT